VREPSKTHTIETGNKYLRGAVEGGLKLEYVWAKGSDESAVKEADRFSGDGFGATERHIAALEASCKYLENHLANVPYVQTKITSMHFRVSEFKKMKSGPGEPFCVLGSTYGDLLKRMDEVAKELAVLLDGEDFELEGEVYPLFDGGSILYAMYCAFRNRVMAGKKPIVTFYVHSKKDKYKLKKLLTEAYRTIQGTDIFLMMLMIEFGECFKKYLYTGVENWMIETTPLERTKFYNGWSDLYTVGSDYTAYDRYVSPQVVSAMFGTFKRAGMPARAADYIRDMISFAPLSFHGGEIAYRQGGNPSGQYWTTMTNCFVHTVYIAYFFSIQAKTVSADAILVELEDRYWVCHGDDEMVGDDLCEAEEYVRIVEAHCHEIGQEVTAEELILDGESTKVFPPGVPAPFLGETRLYTAGMSIPLPTRPAKSAVYAFYKPLDARGEDGTPVFGHVVAGGYQALLGLEAARYIMSSIEVPLPTNKYVGAVSQVLVDLKKTGMVVPSVLSLARWVSMHTGVHVDDVCHYAASHLRQ